MSENRNEQSAVLVSFEPTLTNVRATHEALKAQRQTGDAPPPVWIDGHIGPNPSELISLKNGVLHVPTRKLIPHSCRLFTLNTLPYEYKKEGEPIQWLKFLKSIWPDDRESINTLQEMFGYFLIPDTRQHKMLLIKGPKRSGKGTIARVLEGLVGKDNYTGFSFTSLADRFGLSSFVGKLVAVTTESRVGNGLNRPVVVERLLSISGEDNVPIDQKLRDMVNIRLSTRLVIMTNETPKLGDSAGALASRFIALVMHKSFLGKEDKELTEKLLKELPQIFQWALLGLDRLRERGEFHQPKSGQAVMNELTNLNSPITAFVNRYCELGLNYSVPKAELFEKWQKWCHSNDETDTTNAEFGRKLMDAFPSVMPCQQRDKEKRIKIYKGIKLKTLKK